MKWKQHLFAAPGVVAARLLPKFLVRCMRLPQLESWVVVQFEI